MGDDQENSVTQSCRRLFGYYYKCYMLSLDYAVALAAFTSAVG